MDIESDINRLLADDHAPVSALWLEEAQREYPYFALPAILYLQRTADISPTEREKLLSRIAIAFPDRCALYDLLGEDAKRFENFYPPIEEPATPTTNATLDSFLDRFGKTDDKETEILNQIIFNPTPDYAQMLIAEEAKEAAAGKRTASPAAKSENDLLIEKFIEQDAAAPAPPKTPVHTVTPPPFHPHSEPEKVQQPEAANDSMLSESLAKIYIRQHKYSKALEIIESLSLNFPEKSIYFADQIRFLRKLIINDNIKNNK